jgi:hypothetical protein
MNKWTVFYLPAKPSHIFFVSPREEPFLLPVQATPFFKPQIYHIHDYYTHFKPFLSLYAFTIHHHYPRILHSTHSPQSPHATRSTDSSHHLVTHRIRSYFILSTYTTLPTLLVVDYVGALRGGFHFLVLFCRPYKPRLLPIFLCALSNISQLQSRHVAAILVSYLQLFCVFTIIIPQSLKGFRQFLVPKSVSHLIIQVR